MPGFSNRSADDASRGDIAYRILLALPPATLKRVNVLLEPVTLQRGRVIYRPDALIEKLYFVNRGLVSRVRTMKDGRTVEIGTVGIEGVTGLEALIRDRARNARMHRPASGDGFLRQSRGLARRDEAQSGPTNPP